MKLEKVSPNPVSDAVDFMLEHCKNARWDILARAWQIMESGIEVKIPAEKHK